MPDRFVSEWKRRMLEQEEAEKAETVREYFSEAKGNQPVRRKELISAMDFYMRYRRTKTWWWRLWRWIRNLGRERTVVVVAAPGSGGNGSSGPERPESRPADGSPGGIVQP